MRLGTPTGRCRSTIPSSVCSRRARRSTRSGSATPGAAASAIPTVASSAATSARTAGKRSTGWSPAATTAGRPPKATFDPAVYPQFVEPDLRLQPHSVGGSCSITGGDFGSETNFPGDYQQSYFFGDYVVGFIRRVVLAADGVTVQSVTRLRLVRGGAPTARGSRRRALLSRHHRRARCTASRLTGSNSLRSRVRPRLRAGRRTAHGAVLERGLDRRRRRSADGGRGTSVTAAPVSTAGRPSHTYTALGAYVVTLTVSDDRTPTPGTDVVTLPITVGTPRGRHDQPARGQSPSSRAARRSPAGTAIDAQDGTLPVLGARVGGALPARHALPSLPERPDRLAARSPRQTSGETSPTSATRSSSARPTRPV